ncbi:MAG: hypothetical protein Edafosvirus5_39 [Edafosvirus sp.]|uniref:Uncharacterized protein n=1 Tax=Edafosvirus sp. TaxID=2487765 RepID=A0A3G4ZVV0_9VIRU|nr:MAG: hypothetical protein Edafosvirus5_39 [Edafosvirus sp.]
MPLDYVNVGIAIMAVFIGIKILDVLPILLIGYLIGCKFPLIIKENVMTATKNHVYKGGYSIELSGIGTCYYPDDIKYGLKQINDGLKKIKF